MRRLIINADDFGMTNGINRAVIEAHTQGIVTSTTMMATGSAVDGAVALAVTRENLSVGCHIVLVDGTPASDSAKITTLLEEQSQPRFRSSLASVAGRAVAGRLDPDELEAEATAQIRSLQEKGVRVTHFDTHKHTHLFPAILRPLLRAAKTRGVSALRNPFGQRLPLSRQALRQRPKLWKRFLEVRILSTFASSFRRMVWQSGLKTPDGCFGVVSTGALDLELFQEVVNCIPEGTWEFVCHPGYNDSELAAVRTRLRGSRQKELEVLTSPEARAALDRRGIQLISYREL